MRSTTRKTKAFLAILLASVALLSAAAPGNEKHISVYSPVANYSLPILERGGHEYVGLLELLEPLGRVSSEAHGNLLKLRYNAIDGEFVGGKTRCKIRGHDFDFLTPFLIENSRGYVAINSLAMLLPRFLGGPVVFHESGRRLFLGEVGIQTSFRLDAGNPPRLVVSFSGPVNPTISTEPGKLRMLFKRDPILSPGSQSIAFENPTITHAGYAESNGDAEIEVTANEPLMASFSGDRRTITVSAVPSQGTTPRVVAPVPPNSGAPNPAQANPTPAAPTATISSGGSRRLVAVVDAAHGGDERGAALTDTLAEKDITLGFARLLRHELEIRGFSVIMIRDGDTSVGLDQRATSANMAHAAIYIGLHAASQGRGARVYTALLPVEGPSHGIFHAWNAAQAPVLPASEIVSAAIVIEMRKREFPVHASSASLRPLNNVVMPAVAVELAPGENGIWDLTSANYQQLAASAIADGVVSIRDRLGMQP
ncbi:MAG: N-acetylmuramoyl-L-alanine amidase [Terriglobales bacterium]